MVLGCVGISSAFAQQARGLSLAKAIQTTLVMQPEFLMSKQEIRSAQGVLLQAGQEFDPILSSNLAYQDDEDFASQADILSSHELTDEHQLLNWETKIKKQTRLGIRLEPSVTLERHRDETYFDDTYSQAEYSFALRVPLLKFGKLANAGNELSAKKNKEAALLKVGHKAAQVVKETVNDFWDYLACNRKLKLRRQAESKAEKLLEDHKKLVQGKEAPASDLVQLQADLTKKQAVRVKAEQAVLEAGQKIGLSMGLSVEQLTAVPPPYGNFPQPGQTNQTCLDYKDLFNLARKTRNDLKAIEKKLDAAQIQNKAAQIGLRPDLDLYGTGNYRSRSENGKFDNFLGVNTEYNAGPGYEVGLRVKVPLGNDGAKGQQMEKDSDYQTWTLKARKLNQSIASGVFQATRQVRSTINEYKKMHKSAQYYSQAVADEKAKFNMGATSLINVILLENERIRAKISELDSLANYAKAVSELRYQTGVIIKGDGRNYTAYVDKMKYIPALSQ
jgi:outer membrane protein TolC